jgi:mannose-1-phosphate guanylyltransferase/mannose-6-phosphate isomerase
MKVLVLAGGSGTRLWPLSRKNLPKQFLRLYGDKSLLQLTVERLLNTVSPEDIVVMTNSDYRFHVKSNLEALPAFGNMQTAAHIILEPAGRNTAPAIALGIQYCLEKLGCKDDEVVFVCPSDHIIKPAEKFIQYLRQSEEIAQKGPIVTFGIRPLGPETGYGYIKACPEPLQSGPNPFYKVERFVEKPDRETAEGYISEGNYFWNSGMFMFRIDSMREDLILHEPVIGGMFKKGFEEFTSGFAALPDISIDYAVMEKSQKTVTVPLDLYWNDIGSWDSLYDVLEKDGDGNVKVGEVRAVDTKDTLILGEGRLISTIGLENCLIIETGDAVLVAKRGEARKVKDIVQGLRAEGRKEVTEHVTTYRPWGNYTVLEEDARYKIKSIVVSPLEKLSLQMHYHRSEHWVVVKGTAKVTVGDKEIFVHENESVYVPKSTMHRLENPGKVPLEIIEVQNGEYVGEDDIVRLEDVYGR